MRKKRVIKVLTLSFKCVFRKRSRAETSCSQIIRSDPISFFKGSAEIRIAVKPGFHTYPGKRSRGTAYKTVSILQPFIEQIALKTDSVSSFKNLAEIRGGKARYSGNFSFGNLHSEVLFYILNLRINRHLFFGFAAFTPVSTKSIYRNF